MKSGTIQTNAPARRSAQTADAAVAKVGRPGSVLTKMKFAAAPEQVWGGLLFYEQLEERPPLLLRLLLPIPIATEGAKSQVGDEVKCLYESGHLLKRVTSVDPDRHYGFEVVEQTLSLGGGLALTGGCYTLRELAGGGTEIVVTTRYASSRRPAWLWKPILATACHMFHRHLLSSIEHRIESGRRGDAVEPKQNPARPSSP